jgi:hypothetical protein
MAQRRTTTTPVTAGPATRSGAVPPRRPCGGAALIQLDALQAATRAPAERGHAPLETTVTAVRRGSLCPGRIGAVTAAALVLLHHEHGRTT